MNLIKYLIFFSLFLSQIIFAAGTSDNSKENINYSDEYTLALDLIKQENYNLAINKLKILLNKKSKNFTKADIYNYLGYSHRKIKNYGKAEKYYLEALKINKDHIGALEYIGELYLETNRIEKAKEYLEKLKLVAGENSEEYLELYELFNTSPS
ncbi:MAG: tetratricopeptide repeat protein, partial [Proteobacteria bacterium]|nr:tetratricopeptide repeat protein [Pseudomonadota bacterium]